MRRAPKRNVASFGSAEKMPGLRCPLMAGFQMSTEACRSVFSCESDRSVPASSRLSFDCTGSIVHSRLSALRN